MPQYLEFEVSLLGIKPRIWRRFQLKSSASFQDLHEAIQDAGGWFDGHLFEFQEPGRERRSLAGTEVPEEDRLFEDEDLAPPARKAKVGSWFKKKGDKCVYLYDFGDGWELSVVVKGMVEDAAKFKRRLLGGERAFPPEDCGGPFGYELCVAVMSGEKIADWDEEELAERKEWLGDWRPEDFDLATARKGFDG